MSQLSNEQKPIVIDIEIKKSPRHPPIEARLMKESEQYDTAPTLEEINDHLLRAQERRQERLNRRAQTHTDEKRNKVLMRKLSNDMDTRMKLDKELSKVETAGKKRDQVLLKRINIAHKECEKISQAHQRKTLLSQEKLHEIEEKIMLAQTMADQKRQELNKQVVTDAKHEINKVKMTVSYQKLKEENELQIKKLQMEKKQKLAEMKREEILERKVEHAIEVGQRKSPFKDSAPQGQ